MNDPDINQHESWPWLNWSIVLVFIAAISLIGLISAGVFDPKPVGRLKDTLRLEPVELEAAETRLDWLAPTAPSNSHTLRLKAALAQGELDSAYGLAIGDEMNNIVVAVAPTGYVAIKRNEGQEQQSIIPFRTWPHVAQEHESNELWLDIEDGVLTAVRINRELLWQGAQPVDGQRIGLWAETFGEPSIIDFQTLELFEKSPAG